MKTVGIICEYNPFHNGHARQLRLAREAAGEDCALICLMSGNYVQRGAPAIFPKALRAEAALRCGADLVLELPLTAALSSAEGFAAGGVRILTALGCDALCFGTESEDSNLIMLTAKANLDPAFDALLRAELETGCSYPAARQRVLEWLLKAQTPAGADSFPASGSVGAELEESRMYAHIGPLSILSNPNDLLAVEYCKALLRQKSPMRPLPIRRTGSYRADVLDPEAPSASALRAALEGCPDASAWTAAVPACLRDLYATAPIHTMQNGERAVLAILRALPDEAFEKLPYGSEGLWSKFMKNCRRCVSTEEIIEATKTKRYTRTRIQRMLLCAFLGLTAEKLAAPAPYARILGFNDRGRGLLRRGREELPLVNAGETPPDAEYRALESRAADLYSLFSSDLPRPAGEEQRQRVRYLTSTDGP